LCFGLKFNPKPKNRDKDRQKQTKTKTVLRKMLKLNQYYPKLDG
jgi:hypothetical protein